MTTNESKASMPFSEFLQLTYDKLAQECWLTETYLDPKTHLERAARTSSYDNGLTFHETWTMGGTRGSYTGDVSSVEPQLEPDFTYLDKILEMVTPNIGFLQYKAICSQVIKRGETYHSDYYGGSTTEGYKGFNIEDLYYALVNRKLI